MTDSYTPKMVAGGVTTIGSFAPDELVIAPGRAYIRTIASGSGVVARGTVLGLVKTGAATAAAKAGGNTGNGAISAVTIANPDKVGPYVVTFTSATAFTVEDPDGYVLGNGSTGVTFTDDVAFTITAGGTAFVAGDGFVITVAAGSGKLKPSVLSATDGSQVPYSIAGETVDATSADVTSACYFSGTFNSNKLIYGAGHSLATVFDPFRQVGINLDAALAW